MTTRPATLLLLLLCCWTVAQSSLLQSHARPSPRVESIISSEPNQAFVDYNGHPFDANSHRQLEEQDDLDLDPLENDLQYMTGDGYKTLRIKYIMDPIEGRSDYVTSGFDQTLPDILDLVSKTWSSHLSVIPSNGTIPIRQSDCYSFYSQYIGADLQASGVSDADLAIYVGAETSVTENGQTVDLCDTGTLAFAFTCSIDQFDRPVIGAINFCINNIIGGASSRNLRGGDKDDKDATEIATSVLTEGKSVYRAATLEGNTDFADMALLAVHEVGHALGFTLNLLKYFRDPATGEPQTPRPFTRSNVRCVDGSIQSLYFPSEKTLATRQFPDGRYYHEVVTPRVTQVARNHFDCQSLTGARLENQPTSAAYNCTGSHWDERLFLSELMGPIFSGYSDILSPLTLAILEDSGWYKVSYENAKLSPFGKGRGCDFVNQPCIVNDQVPEYGRDIFCADVNAITANGVQAQNFVCDPTHKSFTACDLFDINDVPATIQARLPSNRIQRFSNPDLVSIFNQADFCPLPVIDARLDCTNQDENTNVPQAYQGEGRGLSSRCINGRIGATSRPGCFPIECNAALHKVVIAGQVCDSDFQELSVSLADFGSGTIICPALATICPDLFCPGECSGRGSCDYTAVPPRCVCDDPTDSSPGCNGGSAAPTPPPISFTQPTSPGAPTTSPPPFDFLPTSDASSTRQRIAAFSAVLGAAFFVFC